MNMWLCLQSPNLPTLYWAQESTPSLAESIPGLIKRWQIRALLIGGPLWCYLRAAAPGCTSGRTEILCRYFDNTVYNNMNLGVVHTCSDQIRALYMRKVYSCIWEQSTKKKTYDDLINNSINLYLFLLYGIHIYISHLRLCNIYKKDICNRWAYFYDEKVCKVGTATDLYLLQRVPRTGNSF